MAIHDPPRTADAPPAEIAARTEAERRLNATNALLKLFVQKSSRSAYLHGVAELLRDTIGCRCVGIRVLNSRGEVPYEASVGYSTDFLRTESCLALGRDECTCTRVIQGIRCPAAGATVTAAGSFYTNDFAAFIASLSPEERAAYRGVCVASGFGSVAILPIRYQETIVGAIHLADERVGRLSPEAIDFLEQASALIGEAAYRFKVEDELRESREQLQAILDNSPVAIYVKDAQGRYLLMNRWCEQILDAAGGRAIGRTDLDILPEPAAKRISENDAVVLRSGIPMQFEEVLPLADGSRVFISLKFPLHNASGMPYAVCGVSTDITELRRAEERSRQHQAELAQALRVRTLGEMASEVAHEINQPLTAIANYAQACLLRLRAGHATAEDLLEDIGQIAVQAERTGEIIRRMRNFVRRGELRQEPADLNALVREAAAFAEAEARRHGVTVQLDLAPTRLDVMADTIQIEQVILNLVRNGVEAMDGQDGARRLIIRTAHAGAEGVEVAVLDTGPGIDGRHMEQVFNPFYTTKPNGMGMGLSISRSIIQAHGGRLWATRNADRGMTFVFRLPHPDGPR